MDIPPATSGVQVGDKELVVPDGVTAAIEPFVGGPLSLKSINDISRAAVLAYREAGLPVVDIGFPEQNVSDGVLQLVIIVGRAGEISVKGNRYFDENIYLRSFRTQPGEILWEAPIVEDLTFLNRNRYRQVDMVYSPGTEFGAADIILQANEIRPWTVYTGYENTGNEFIGEDRFFLGGEWGNAFGLDHILGYQYTTTGDFDSLHAHSASYSIPIWQLRHELRFLAAYVESSGSLFANTAQALVSSGKSSQLSTTYAVPLPKIFGYDHEVDAGFDFKSSNNNLEFGGIDVFANTAEIFQFSIGETLQKKQKKGHQRISHRVIWSPGEMSNHNTNAAFNQIRALSSSDYVYWKGDFTQSVDLPHGFTFLFDSEAQISNTNLLPSETLILGGVGSVRGFEQNLTRADEGFRMTMELYAPSISLLDKVGNSISEDNALGGIKDSARFFAFYDQAWAGNKILLPGEPEHIQLGGAGLGLDYRINNNFSARVSHGWQVDESGFGNDGENGRWHIFATMRY